MSGPYWAGMTTCLIGHTGFVGSNLHRQAAFDDVFRSTNIGEIAGRQFDLVVCAGISAVKWKANQDPAADRAGIATLREALESVTAQRFVLISTVDVYPAVRGVDEQTDCSAPNHAYGAHRLAFEDFVRSRFPTHHVVRLPGLYGPSLKKNVLYDLLHDHRCGFIDPAARFQWYDVRRLWADVGRVIAAELALVNLVPEPVATADLVEGLFEDRALAPPSDAPWAYDIRSRHAAVFGGVDGWIAPAADVVRGIHRWVRAERGR